MAEQPSSEKKSAEVSVVKPYLYKNEGIFSEILYLFGRKVVKLGDTPGFVIKDLFPLKESWQFDSLYSKYEKDYEGKVKSGGNFKYAFYKSYMCDFWISILYWTISSLMSFAVPFLIKSFVAWMNSSDSSSVSTSGDGWLFGSLIIVGMLIKVLFRRRSMFVSFITQFQFGLTARALVYSKFDKLSSEAIRNLDIGKLSNILSSDIWTLQAGLRFSQVLFVTPFVLIGVTVYLILQFNLIAFLIPGVFFLVTIIQLLLTKISAPALKSKKELSDKRAKYITEVITGIKNIKFQGWEAEVLKKVEEIRSAECKLLRKYILARAVALYLSDLSAPLAILFFLFIYTIVLGRSLTLADSYLLISLVNQVAAPVRMMTIGMEMISSANIGLNRLKLVMMTPETEKQQDDTSLPVNSIVFENYSAGWFSDTLTNYFKTNQEKLNTLAIQNINYNFEAGKLYAILGEVGSGKSSLLLSVLNDLITKNGKVVKNGEVALISQSAFLLNASIKDNILFYNEYNEDKYKKALILSCLFDDIQQLPGGDMTEIGERGINLSGGQKQRISIARAIYANKGIYLVDDCLSALDAEVGKKIFYGVFKRELKGKTILMVTHATSVLPDCDEILLLKNGKLVMNGPYENIKNNPNYIEYFLKEEKEKEKTPALNKNASKNNDMLNHPPTGTNENFNGQLQGVPEQMSPASMADLRKMEEEDEREYQKDLKKLEEIFIKISEKKREEMAKKGAITVAETRREGTVSWKYFGVFISSYGTFLFIIYIMASCSFIAAKIFSEFWVGAWAKNEYGHTRGDYCFGLSMIDLTMALLVVTLGLIHSSGMINAAFRLNHKLTRGILKNKLEFFDGTPIGVIINRFTKDVDIVDGSMSFMVAQFIFQLIQITGIFILVMITVPYIIILVVFCVFVFYSISKQLIKVASDMRRLMLMAASPILSNVSETLNGALMIKASKIYPQLRKKFVDNSAKLAQVEIHERVSQNYIFQTIELLTILLLFFTLLLIILIKIFKVEVFSDANVLALSINWIALSVELIGFVLFSYQEFNSGINCVERLHDMSIPVKEEANFDAPKPPRASWPETGKIDFEHVNARYRDGLPLVLKDINLNINDKEKVGIVGRTGSGKSTMILALKRMIDLAKDEGMPAGRILIDDVDASSIGLTYYRPAVVLIPQDPFLLSGTVKSNIDPFGKHTEEEIEAVLKKTQIFENLYDTIGRVITKGDPKDQAMGNKVQREGFELQALQSERDGLIVSDSDKEKTNKVLNFQIKDGGGNISQGQRQLLCIARAIISKPKILLMDEATANIDGKTDQIIQKVIKTEFSQSTVLTIAHRLNTIIQYDRVIVMSNGSIVDQGTPLSLLDRDSVFRELVMELGEDNFKKMRLYATDRSLDPILD